MIKKKHHEEEHENSERWLLTYADLITLLLGLFVVLYSTAQQDTEKFKKAMRAMVKVLNPDKEEKLYGNNKEFSLIIGKESSGEKENELCDEKGLEKLREEIEKNEAKGSGITARMSEEGLIIDMEERVLFDTGKAELKNEGIETLKKISPYLKKVKNKIKILGHTDNVPIKNSLFPSNWHLGMRRAEKTSEFLIFNENIDLKRFVSGSLADTNPVSDNKTDEGRRRNRRVEIIILKEEKKQNKDDKQN
ncbi:MAG: OmpA family protein [Elusimicrobiales bacterium]|nr:OmpA family protein [Elusimicrobiales bacterium]